MLCPAPQWGRVILYSYMVAKVILKIRSVLPDITHGARGLADRVDYGMVGSLVAGGIVVTAAVKKSVEEPEMGVPGQGYHRVCSPGKAIDGSGDNKDKGPTGNVD